MHPHHITILEVVETARLISKDVGAKEEEEEENVMPDSYGWEAGRVSAVERLD